MTDTGFQPAQPADYAPRSAANFAHHDPAAWLPPAAAERLRQLQLRADDARNLLPDWGARHEASTEKQAAAQRLKRLLDPPQLGGFGMPDDHVSVAVARCEAERTAAVSKRLEDLHSARSAAVATANAVLSQVTTWLRDGGKPAGTVLEPVEIEAPKLLKNESLADGVERLRRRVRELRADLHRIRSAPYPASYCKARARAQIEALAQRGAVNVGALIEHDGDIEFPALQLRTMVHNATPGAVAFHETADAVALICWAFKDALVKQLDAEIDAEADDAAALSVEARQQQEAAVLGDLTYIERQEAELAWQSAGQVEHRSDISPAALLSVRLLVRPAVAPPPTIAGMTVDVLMPGGR